MAWTTPKTWASGEIVSAANLNAHLRDNLNYLKVATTKGDLQGFDGTSFVRLPVGTNNFVLMADSAQTTGIKWARSGGLASYGTSTYATQMTRNETQTTYVDTNLSVAVTPTAATNVLVVRASIPVYTSVGGSGFFALLKDSTVKATVYVGAAQYGTHVTLDWTEAAGGTAAQTWKVQFRYGLSGGASQAVYAFYDPGTGAQTGILTCLEYVY